MVVFRVLHGHVGVDVVEGHRRGQGLSLISMKWRSLVGVAIAVDPAVVAPSRVVARKADVGAVGDHGLIISVMNGRSVVRWRSGQYRCHP